MEGYKGNPIHAHGGYMIFHEGYYYWYSEDRRDNFYVQLLSLTEFDRLGV